MNYLSWEKTYLQRRFHANEFLHTLSELRAELITKKIDKRHSQSRDKPISTTISPSTTTSNNNTSIIDDKEKEKQELLQKEAEHDIFLQQRFQRFVIKHNGKKPLLVLDVDNTMLYVRFFSEEMSIGDIVTYFLNDEVERNNARVIEIEISLWLEVTDNELIDELGEERILYSYYVKDNDALKVCIYIKNK